MRTSDHTFRGRRYRVIVARATRAEWARRGFLHHVAATRIRHIGFGPLSIVIIKRGI